MLLAGLVSLIFTDTSKYTDILVYLIFTTAVALANSLSTLLGQGTH